MLPHPIDAPRAGVRAFFAPVDLLTGDSSAIPRALRWLDPAERERYGRYRHDVDRHMFLLGRIMARALVGRELGVAPAAWQWTEGPRGRPEIAAPPTDLRFNLSHSAGLVVCALAHGREVGIDVEDLDRRPLDRAIVARYCAPAERADIDAHGGDWLRRFLVYWTLKEAYLKARGLGVALPLAELCFCPSDSIRLSFLGSLAGASTAWSFALARPTPSHIVAVALEGTADAAAGLAIEPFPADLLP
jgi:4'-phosphopantetheinyl transferase